MALVSQLAGIAEARLKHVARRTGRQAAMYGICGLLALLILGFLIAAGTVALAHRYGTVGGLLIAAALAFVLLLVALLIARLDNRAEREIAARRAGADQNFTRAAMLSATNSVSSAAASAAAVRPSRGVVGAAMVAMGALLILTRRRRS